MKEKLDDVTIDTGKKKDTLKKLEGVVGDYIADMRGLVKEKSEGETRVDTWDISYNIGQIHFPIADFALKVNTAIVSGFHIQWGNAEEAVAETEKLERNYERLENFRSGSLVSLGQTLLDKVKEIRDIYDKYLEPFETMDDAYRGKINDIYDECTNSEDKWENFWDSFKSVATAFGKAFAVAFVSAVVLALAPGWLVLGALAVVGVGCVVLVNVPEESVPSWMQGAKKAADGAKEKAIEVMKEGPIVLVEDIGQGLMDTVQTPEGIATVSGAAIGTLAGGWAGAKIKAKVKAPKTEVPFKKGSKGTETFDDYMKLVEKLDVSTEPNTATFYSGEGNRKLAELFAKNNGKTTLEMTSGGKYLDNMKLFADNSPLTKNQAADVWKRLSERYAQEASGNAYGFVQGARDGSIFNTVEYPTLQNNSNIKNIFTELFKSGGN